MQVSSAPLVGRSVEVGYLREALAAARAGRGAAVFVVADAGLGKSRLLGETVDEARAAGMAVLRGRATESGATVPYRPLTEALFSLDRVGAVPDEPELAPYRAALGRLIPQRRPGSAADSDDSPVVLAESVLRLLGAISRGRGALMCLGNLQGCDAETMYVLEYLLDNLADQPVLLLGSMHAAPSPALALARGAARRRVARLMELAPLTDDQVVELVAGCLDTTVARLPEALARWIVQTADGNPFVVEELLAECADAGVLTESAGTWRMTGRPPREMPATVVTSVNDRARRRARCRPPSSPASTTAPAASAPNCTAPSRRPR